MAGFGDAALTGNNQFLSDKKKKKKSYKKDSQGRHSHLNTFFTDMIQHR